LKIQEKKEIFFRFFFGKYISIPLHLCRGGNKGIKVLGKIPCSPAFVFLSQKKYPSKGRALFISSRGFDVAYA
jgi:hypothetical protein